MLDIGLLEESVHAGAFSKGFVHDELPLARRLCEEVHEFVKRLLVKVLCETETVAAFFHGPDGLLEGLLVCFADAHHLAHGAHLGAELVLGAREFFEIPAGELHDHVIAPGCVFIECPLAPVWDLIQGETAGEKRGHESDGETRGLGGEGRRPGRPRVDLDHHHPSRVWIVGELNVRAPDYLDRLDDIIGVFLKFFLKIGIDGQHGSGAVGVSRVHPHGVHVFDEAYGDHLVFGIPYHFKLQFLPAQNRFLHEDLTHETRRDAAAGHGAKLFQIIDESSSRAAHGIGGPDHDRVSEPDRDALGLLNAVSRFALRHLDAETIHGILEGDPVLASFNGIHLDADDLDTVFFENSLAGEL